ncbi:MAG: hypothetical protein F4Y39_21185 [Gemmatimonadetes bacterium]|nr:hypothetical protein [Gemmatimonadota bacterium]MYF75623.1 hypothetical protein [Gemmatimonadota bacterium]
MEQMTIQYEALSRLTPDESLVWDMLSTSHRGRDEAVTQAVLSVAAGMPARRLRNIIKSLVQVHGLPVGSTPHSPAGYFVVETPEELAEIVERYYRGALSLLYRMRRLKDIPIGDLAEQLMLDLRTYTDKE